MGLKSCQSKTTKLIQQFLERP